MNEGGKFSASQSFENSENAERISPRGRLAPALAAPVPRLPGNGAATAPTDEEENYQPRKALKSHKTRKSTWAGADQPIHFHLLALHKS
jgi:hypothetical protein